MSIKKKFKLKFYESYSTGYINERRFITVEDLPVNWLPHTSNKNKSKTYKVR